MYQYMPRAYTYVNFCTLPFLKAIQGILAANFIYQNSSASPYFEAILDNDEISNLNVTIDNEDTYTHRWR
jgi:hypothetical protein